MIYKHLLYPRSKILYNRQNATAVVINYATQNEIQRVLDKVVFAMKVILKKIILNFQLLRNDFHESIK